MASFKKSDAVETRKIGNVEIAILEKEEAISLISRAVGNRRAFLICFANAHTINTARGSKVFARALQHALVLNDGVGVDIASKWLYKKAFPANLNGTDFTPELMNRLPGGTRIYLLGSPPGVAERAAKIILSQHSHLKIVGTQNGYFADEDEADILTQINASAPDVVLVAMGHPRQEIWAARNLDLVGVPVMCVGALFDFYAGTAQRAPLWLRQIRVEWAFRLLKEPRRLARRYLIGNAAFLFHIWTTKRREGLSRTDPP